MAANAPVRKPAPSEPFSHSNLLTELTCRVESARALTVPSRTPEEFEKLKVDASARSDEAAGGIARLREQMAETQEAIERVRSEMHDVSTSKADLKREEVSPARVSTASPRAACNAARPFECSHIPSTTQLIDMPRVKHAISLYANISCIKWDYASPDIAGIVAPSGASATPGKGARTFCIKRDKCSEFEVANQLWDIVDASA